MTIRLHTKAQAGAKAIALTFLLTVVLAGALAAAPTRAQAASADSIDSYRVAYTVDKDGTVHVQEAINYRFGSSSARHGIYRNLVTREPYVDDKSKDQIYEISNVMVSSPTSGVSTEFTKTTIKRNDDREQNLQLKIGSATKTVSGATALYVISYQVKGALRHFTDHSEFYWDVVGTGWTVSSINDVSATVTVPGRVTAVACFAGAPGSQTSCDSSSMNGPVASFGETSLRRGHDLSVVTGIPAGAVANDAPIVTDPPSAIERTGLSTPAMIGSGVVSFLGLAGALAYRRFGNEDERFAGLPPGTFPPSGIEPQVVKDTVPASQIPVAFAPPAVPVAEAGLLIDSTLDTRETAATLIDLAVRGGVRIGDDNGTQYAELIDPMVATAPHEQALITGLFPTYVPGTRVVLARGKVGERAMFNAHTAVTKAVRQQVAGRGYFSRQPSAGRRRPTARGPVVLIWFVVVSFFIFNGFTSFVAFTAGGGLARAVVVIVPIAAVIGGLVVAGHFRGRGRRSAAGRAVTDQAVGFRQYLATAEADQLRFEEGEDIFSRYLPWAIAFNLAYRWQQVCQKLVEQGRIPAQPSWYAGPSYYSNPFLFSSFANNVQSSFSPPPTPSSGGGGGSSSGFSGGGSSGGGGGGGGGGSW